MIAGDTHRNTLQFMTEYMVHLDRHEMFKDINICIRFKNIDSCIRIFVYHYKGEMCTVHVKQEYFGTLPFKSTIQ